MTVFVTGGRSPLALSLVEKLISDGQDVILATRKIDLSMESLAAECGGCKLVELDLSARDQVESIARGLLSDVDVRGLVFCHRARDADPLEQYWANVLAPAQLVDSFAGNGGGDGRSVVFYTSPAARVVVADADFQYHASKAAINAFVRFAAVAYADTGVRVNAVSPGAFVFKKRSSEYFERNPSRVRWAERVTPLGRFAAASEISDATIFLLGSPSSFITGQVLEVDGGTMLLDQPGLEN